MDADSGTSDIRSAKVQQARNEARVNTRLFPYRSNLSSPYEISNFNCTLGMEMNIEVEIEISI